MLTPGGRLGTYQILAPLGAGGMGEVYRAKDLRLGREVAVKVLPPELASNVDHLTRFEREARIVAGLNHPNIVTLFSVEEENGVHFLTMELVEGRSLAAHIPPEGLSPTQVLDLAVPIADALVAAHERRVIHRDLKPGNVMVTPEGRVKVLDFGLAKPGEVPHDGDATFAATEEAPISGRGDILGTVPYMAPEQLRGEAADARSDLFALGIILYELTAGRRPFTGKTPVDIGSSILRDTPEPLVRTRPGIPGDLHRIVSRCLEKNPRDRFQTALDVSNELKLLRKRLERGEPAGSDRVASIAVLPFVNRSASVEDEYFSDGLADELLNVLAKIRGLRVVARTSAFAFKGKQVTIAEVGRALDVATVLEGSVRRAGDRLRISVQLVAVSDGGHLWSETYDRTLNDIFAVQDEIAHSVVKELRQALLGEHGDSDGTSEAEAEVARAAKGRGTDPEAHRLYLLARHFFDRSTQEDVAKGVQCLREALERDSKYAIAWAQLAEVLARESDMGWVPIEDGYGRAREAVERALALEPDLAEGHAQIGRIQMLHERDWHRAGGSFARALELAPGNAVALRGAGALAMNSGHLDEAIALTRRSLERDPLSASAYTSLGMSLFAADRFREAEDAFRRALELSPQRGATHAYLALTLAAQGRGDEATREAEREPHDGFRFWALAMVCHVAGRDAEADAALRELTEKFADGGAFQIAEVYGTRGEPDAAFQWLERAYAERDGGLAEMKASPRLRSLHGDPRWRKFLIKVGFSQ